MTQVDRRRLTREYKQTPRPAGVFVVRNNVTGASLVGTSPDLPGMLNRQRFQLEMGSHPDHGLQADYNAIGPEAFDFLVLDQLEPDGDAQVDQEDLTALRDLWIDRLVAQGVPLYRQSMRRT